MNIHLDTSFMIEALIAGSGADTRLRRWLSDGESFAVSTLVWSEFMCGPISPTDRRLARGVIQTVIDFSTQHAEDAAVLFNATGRRRGTLNDCMIGAVAMAHDAPLATLNERHFERFRSAGLRMA